MTHSLTISQQRQRLRKQLRQQRKQLSPAEQQFANFALIDPACRLIERYQAQHIAAYLPFDGEISPLPLFEKLANSGKSLYLPVLHPFSKGQLLFLRYQADQLRSNRFGILEPMLDVRNVLPLPLLDLIFVPLVGCDKALNRLGMGGGFYDRTLPHTKAVRVGLAHRCQQVEQLPTEPWDQPLDELIVI